MTPSPPNPKVDWYFAKAHKWQVEFEHLRTLLLGCGLTEELKWGVACYTFEGGNIALIHGFKNYCAVLFVKGALLQDPHHILVAQTEHTQSARQVRFTSPQEIADLTPVLQAYLQEAVAVEKAGLKVELKRSEKHPIPEEFQGKLDENPALKTAFASLTPGRQRAYLLYFSTPKQAKTRAARVEKCAWPILQGKGLHD